MRKKQIWKKNIAVSAAVLLLSQPAFAAVVVSGGPGSTSYSQITQQTTTSTKTVSGQTTKKIEASSAAMPTESYNKELGMYEQEFGNGRRMVTSIGNGSQVADSVYVQVPDNALVRLELDGREHSFQNGVPLTEAGYYVMLVNATVVGSTARADAVFRFRILPPPAGKRDTGEYVWPKVTSALRKSTINSDGLTLFTLANKAGFLTDVPGDNEKVTTAEFFFPPNVSYLLTKDGAGVEYYNQEVLTSPGRYTLKVSAPSQAYSGDYAAFYESTFHFVIPTNADDSLLAASAQPVSGQAGGFTESGGSGYQSASGSTSSGSVDPGTVNSGGELTYQSDMVKETWKEGAKLYEERFSNGIVFYSNVADSDIVGGGVYLDIPADVGVKMKRDGTEVPFLNKEILNTEGTYLLTLTSNTNLGNDKNIYQSFFHFRIQSGTAMAGSAPTAGAAGNSSQSELLPEGLAGTEGTAGYESGLGTEGAAGSETPTGSAGAENQTGTTGSENPADSAGTSAEGAGTDSQAGAKTTKRQPVITAPPSGEGYDENQGMYSFTFADNSVSYSSAPQNSISNTPVKIYLPEGGKGTIFTDEKSVELPKGVSVDQDGSYRAEITSAGGETYTWEFQVMSRGTNSMTEITAPKGYYIDGIVKDETMLEDSQYTDTYPITEDGIYTVSYMPYYQGYPEWFLAVSKDTVAPTLTFEGLDEDQKATGKEVTFTCSDETADITLLRGKKAVAVSGNKVSGGGTYTITAADAAGNSNTYTFRIPGQANLMTTCAFLFLLILALGFVTYSKVYGEKFKAR